MELTEERRRSLEIELRRELPVGHVLSGQTVVARAIGNDPDDVVFELADGRLAVAHLTWKFESDPRWPFTLLFDDVRSLGECIE